MWSNCRSKPQKEWNLFSLRDQSLCHHDPLLQYIYFNPLIVIHDWELGFRHINNLPFAHTQVSVMVSTACGRASTGEFGIAKGSKGCSNARNHERDRDCWTCSLPRHCAHQHVHPCTDRWTYTWQTIPISQAMPSSLSSRFQSISRTKWFHSSRVTEKTVPNKPYFVVWKMLWRILYMVCNGSPFDSLALVSKHVHHCTDRWNLYLRDQTNFTRYDT